MIISLCYVFNIIFTKQFLPLTWNFPSKMVISYSHAHIKDFPSLILTVWLWVILEFISIFWLFFFLLWSVKKNLTIHQILFIVFLSLYINSKLLPLLYTKYWIIYSNQGLSCFIISIVFPVLLKSSSPFSHSLLSKLPYRFYCHQHFDIDDSSGC